MNRLLRAVRTIPVIVNRGAKAVAKKKVKVPPRVGGVPRRLGRITEGPFVLEGEQVKQGEMIWNSARQFAGPWSCYPGMAIIMSHN